MPYDSAWRRAANFKLINLIVRLHVEIATPLFRARRSAANIVKIPEPRVNAKELGRQNPGGLSLEPLLRADMCHGVAPLPLLADCSGSTGSRTAEASRSRLLALGAGRHHGLVRMGRVSQSNRHDSCKKRYSESLQHSFFLPR
jgi:hypothetical protein